MGDGVTRCDGAPQVSTAVCDSLRRGDGTKWAGAGIDNDPGDGLTVHWSQVPTQRATLSSCAGQCPDADEGEWDATYKQRSGRGEVLMEEFWSNCFAVRCSVQVPTGKDGLQRASRATKQSRRAARIAWRGMARCEVPTTHTCCRPAAAIAQPRASAAQPSPMPRGHCIMVPIAKSDCEMTRGAEGWQGNSSYSHTSHMASTKPKSRTSHEAGQSSAVVVFGLASFQGIFCFRLRPPQHVPIERDAELGDRWTHRRQKRRS